MADAKFQAKEAFQYQGFVWRQDAIITMDEETLKDHIAMGCHPTTQKPMSPVLNHCVPVNDLAKELTGFEDDAPDKDIKKEKDLAELNDIKMQMTAMGASFDNRYGLNKMRNELIAAKKAKGE